MRYVLYKGSHFSKYTSPNWKSKMATTKSLSMAVYDDNINDFDIIRDIIDTNNQEEAFYILDVGTIVRQHKKWCSAMPTVTPHYAVKCNPNDTVIRVLASLNGRFDCASKQEIEQVMRAGVSNDRIVFANPHKPHSHIRYAKKVGVKTMMIDNAMEVQKIKEIFPDAKLVIRLAIDGDSCGIKLSTKFGCKPTDEVITLMNYIKEQEMYLQGFSFHLGTPCWDSKAYGRGIQLCAKLIKTGRQMGFEGVNLIDIGGGIPGIGEEFFYKIAESVNEALMDLDPSIEVISEPGRYYVQTAFTLATFIHSKRMMIHDKQVMTRHYYINDGVFGSFIEELMGVAKRVPIPLQNIDGEVFHSVIWGPTCASTDRILDDIMIQDLSIGDWMVWQNMGSYTISIASKFNGFSPPTIFPVIRRTDLNKLSNDINMTQESSRIQWMSENKCD